MNKWMWSGGKKGIRTHRKIMTEWDIRIYHRQIVQKRALGTYCENCGIGLGDGFINKKMMFNVYYVCEGCSKILHKELRTGKPQSAPNLNDLIAIGGMDGQSGLQHLPAEEEDREAGEEDRETRRNGKGGNLASVAVG